MKNRGIFRTVLLYTVFIVFTIAVKTVDVLPLGPEDTDIGFGTVNGMIHVLTGVNEIWYDITKYLGIFAFFVVGIFAGIGFWQMVKRKSLFKIDTDILLLGGFYVLVLCFYVLFEKVIINYRPVILDEGLEASYPSSHTMLIICVMGTAIMQIARRVKQGTVKVLLTALAVCVLVITVIGRTICGVHWFTDIVGGIILSCALISTYDTLCVLFVKEKSQRK